ncbi:MAG: 1,2-phenylacetyl-CoA epoxidase subunit B [Chitinophagaceae bacterium]|nr:1,2-phenylacetyl-CoA epoxidase subunit B [Chitinophagaceae bacterium]
MENANTQFQQWEVFIQAKNGSPFEHAGSIHAADKKMALQNARDIYTRRCEGRSLWVVPTNAIAATVAEEEAEFFDPADDKIYRTPNFYKMPKGTTNL